MDHFSDLAKHRPYKTSSPRKGSASLRFGRGSEKARNWCKWRNSQLSRYVWWAETWRASPRRLFPCWREPFYRQTTHYCGVNGDSSGSKFATGCHSWTAETDDRGVRTRREARLRTETERIRLTRERKDKIGNVFGCDRREAAQPRPTSHPTSNGNDSLASLSALAGVARSS